MQEDHVSLYIFKIEGVCNKARGSCISCRICARRIMWPPHEGRENGREASPIQTSSRCRSSSVSTMPTRPWNHKLDAAVPSFTMLMSGKDITWLAMEHACCVVYYHISCRGSRFFFFFSFCVDDDSRQRKTEAINGQSSPSHVWLKVIRCSTLRGGGGELGTNKNFDPRLQLVCTKLKLKHAI